MVGADENVEKVDLSGLSLKITYPEFRGVKHFGRTCGQGCSAGHASDLMFGSGASSIDPAFFGGAERREDVGFLLGHCSIGSFSVGNGNFPHHSIPLRSFAQVAQSDLLRFPLGLSKSRLGGVKQLRRCIASPRHLFL